MKNIFLWVMAALLPAALISYFLWSVGKALWEMFQDWRTHRELDELQRQSAERRKQNAVGDDPNGPADRADYTSRL